MVLLSTLTKEEQRLKRKNWKRHLLLHWLLQLPHNFGCWRAYYCWLLSFVLLALSSSQLFCAQIWDLILWLGSPAVEWVPNCLWGSEEKLWSDQVKGTLMLLSRLCRHLGSWRLFLYGNRCLTLAWLGCSWWITDVHVVVVKSNFWFCSGLRLV